MIEQHPKPETLSFLNLKPNPFKPPKKQQPLLTKAWLKHSSEELQLRASVLYGLLHRLPDSKAKGADEDVFGRGFFRAISLKLQKGHSPNAKSNPDGKHVMDEILTSPYAGPFEFKKSAPLRTGYEPKFLL